MERIEVINFSAIERILKRIAFQIVEDHPDAKNLVIIAVKTGGINIAKRIKNFLEELYNVKILYGELDISLYYEDYSKPFYGPIVHSSNIPFSISEKDVIIIDDVMYSGRTGFAAVNALLDVGKPKTVKLVTLVETGEKELPVKADYVGKFIEGIPEYRVEVEYDFLKKTGGVYFIKK